MTEGGDSEFDRLPLPVIVRVNARCDAFELECRAGRRPRVEDYLGDTAGAERDTLARLLAQIAADYREVTAEELLHRLAAERLLPEGLSSTPAGTAASLADELIQSGVLTAYQARNLLAPHPHPLALDDYLIVDRVAAGGMGTVYRAVHRRMKREVAVKVSTPDRSGDGERSRLFQREVEAAGRLTHPNVVTAYDAGEARGVAYLVSEFVDGADLQRWVAEHGPLSPADAIQAIRDAAAGLTYAHECGVIHRDVKPSNLIRTRNGIVRVLDVGLARLARTGTDEVVGRRAAVVGTPDFMAPEQAADPDAADARSDIYSLGCTLYYVLTGKRMADATVRVPPPLGELVSRMTATRPEGRFQSMAEVVASLDAMTAPTPGRRRFRVFAALAIAVSAAGLVVVLGLSDKNRTRQTPALRSIPFDAEAYQTEWAASTGLPVEIEPLPGLKARLIPPGRFVMGSPAAVVREWLSDHPEEHVRERVRAEAERPAAVEAPFYLAATELTVAQFRAFTQAQSPPYLTVAERPDGVGYRLTANRAWEVAAGASWREAGEQPLTDDYPVCNLGRDDCADYCRWLTIQLGGRFECRLPTEVEWEYACRAGSAGLWSCGSDANELGPLAWFSGTVDADDARFRPVGRKAANGFGLFDLHGNLEEWCTASPPETGAVLRGGHVRCAAVAVRSAVREPTAPTAPRGGCRIVLVPRP